MSGDRILLDSNIILYFLKGDESVSSFFYQHTPSLSFVSELEILSGPELSSFTKQSIKNLLADITIIGYQVELKEIIVDIRSSKRLKLPDSIIAATAIYLKIPLMTADKSFQKVPELDLILYEK